MTAAVSGTTVGPAYLFLDQYAKRADGITATFTQHNTIRAQPKVGPNINGGSVTQTSMEQIFNSVTVDGTVGSAALTTLSYYAPKNPTLTAGGTIGTMNVMDIPNISGPTTIRGINSAMNNGTFINHTGTATSFFGGDIELDNLASLFVGDVSGIEFSRPLANFLRMTGDGINLDWDFDSTGGGNIALTASGAGGMNFDLIEIAFGPSTVADGTNNWVFAFSPGLRGTQLAGEYSEVLFTSSSSISVGHAISEFSTWKINFPSVSIGAGSVTDAMNVLIATNPNVGTNRYGLWIQSNPSGGGGLNHSLRVAGSSLFDSEVEIDGTLNHDGTFVGFYGVTPVIRPSAYTVTNATPDKTYDANATSTAELADVLATLINDLISVGLLQGSVT